MRIDDRQYADDWARATRVPAIRHGSGFMVRGNIGVLMDIARLPLRDSVRLDDGSGGSYALASISLADGPDLVGP